MSGKDRYIPTRTRTGRRRGLVAMGDFEVPDRFVNRRYARRQPQAEGMPHLLPDERALFDAERAEPFNVTQEYGVSDGDDIGDPIEDAAEDDRILLIDPGTYTTDGMELTDYQNLAIEPTGVPFSVVLEPQSRGNRTLQFAGGSNLVVGGLLVRLDGEFGGEIGGDTEGDLLIHDVKKIGKHNAEGGGFRMSVSDVEGMAIMSRCSAPDGTGLDPSIDGSAGLFVNKQHAGGMLIRDVELSQWNNNAVYASPPGDEGGGGGIVTVRRGLFRDNNIAGVRLSSVGSTVADSVFVNTQDATNNSRGTGMRAVWMRSANGENTVRNCDFVQDISAESEAPIVHITSAEGFGNVVGCRIRNETSDEAINAGGSDPVRWDAIGNHMTGAGSYDVDYAPIREIATVSGEKAIAPRESARTPRRP